MRKLAYVVAAISAIAIAAPSIANAETVVIKRHGHHDRGLHMGWHHHDRGWHNGWRHHNDRTVIIKNHRHEG